MLISTGRVSHSEPWRILEVAMNQQPDVLALRISKELKRLHQPAQALIPFTPTATGQPDWIVPHVYVRGLNESLKSLARTAGIECVRQEQVDQHWIDELQAIEEQNVSVAVGSFVRCLAGPCARMCGEVLEVQHGTVTVLIQMPTKKVKVHTAPQSVQPIEKISAFFA